VAQLERAKQRLNNLGTMRGKWQEIDGVLVRIDRVLAQTEQVPSLGERLNLLKTKLGQLQLLADVNAKKQQVERQLGQLDRILHALGRAEGAEQALLRLEQLTERQKRLMQMNETLFDLGDRLRKADVYLHTNALELTEKLESYSRELKNSGTCPTCFAPIDEHTTERLLEEFRGGHNL
jgi:exonuclease SbcC